MKKKLNDLKDKRAKIIVEQRKIVDLAEKEKRSFTADEETKYENLNVDFDQLTDEIKEVEKEIEKRDKEELRKNQLQDRENFLKQSANVPNKPDTNSGDQTNNQRKDPELAEYRINSRYQPLIEQFRKMSQSPMRSTRKYLDAFTSYLLRGSNNMSHEERNLLVLETRALQADLDPAGGYLVAPEQFIMQMIEAMDNMVFVRQYANIISVPNAQSLGAPARETDMGDVSWTAEIGTGSADSSLAFGKRELTPHPLARRILASKRLLRVAMIDIAGYIAQRFGYKIGTVQENAYLNGSGINQPLGVFTASDMGISASQDVSTGNTTTAMTADGLIECKYSLPKQYRQLPGMRWCFHRTGVKMIRKLKDGNGQYLWKQGLSDKPDTILEIPFEESEYAPSTFTTGKYVGILGDWGQYWIADALDMQIQVLIELYAATNQNGYICRYEGDGMPVIENCWARVKLA